MNPELKKELEKQNSVKGVFDCLNKFYKLEEAKLSPLTKGMLFNYLEMALKIVNAKTR